MSKHISAGDTLTVGDLTDDHLGAVIEVGAVDDITYRFRLNDLRRGDWLLVTMRTARGSFKSAPRHETVTVITPPPVVQPDEPTIPGQCIRIEGSRELLGVVADPGSPLPIYTMHSGWMDWEEALARAGDRRIIVSDPPRWPDEDDGPKPGDTFDRIAGMPYGWVAKALDDDGFYYGHVVREDTLNGCTHRWDAKHRYGLDKTANWGSYGSLSPSGSVCQSYTLVETAEDHDARIAPVVPERIEVDEWPDDDTHIRAWEWIDADGDAWRWYDEPDSAGGVGWMWFPQGPRRPRLFGGPWTRGERVE